MRAVLLWLVTLISIAAAVFFWLRQSDLQSRLDGLAASSITHATASQAQMSRLREMEALVDVLDRAFARGLNAQDSLSRDFARLATSADQAELRSAIEARIEKLKSDLEGPAKSVRDLLLSIDPPDYKLDPEKISDAANAAFLAKIDADPSYTRTASGLRYKPLKTLDSGPKPTPENEVTVHYQGTFIEGTEFDSSYKTGEPATFPLDRLIAGWVEGIPLMKQGEIFELILPYDLAYGIAGRSSIPPRQTLIFRVELLGIAPPPDVATP